MIPNNQHTRAPPCSDFWDVVMIRALLIIISTEVIINPRELKSSKGKVLMSCVKSLVLQIVLFYKSTQIQYLIYYLYANHKFKAGHTRMIVQPEKIDFRRFLYKVYCKYRSISIRIWQITNNHSVRCCKIWSIFGKRQPLLVNYDWLTSQHARGRSCTPFCIEWTHMMSTHVLVWDPRPSMERVPLTFSCTSRTNFIWWKNMSQTLREQWYSLNVTLC